MTELAPFGVAPSDSAAVADMAATLADLGMIPESVERVGSAIEGVVVARVEEVDAIPGADRIRRVVVDAGTKVEVVCGASNFAQGDLVALAPVGAVLPGADGPLERRRMKGVTSNGMLCSPVELGLWEDRGGLLVLPAGAAEVGMPLASVPGLGPDVLFDLEIQANRPDALSVAGVARDLAARVSVAFGRAGSGSPSTAGGAAGARGVDRSTVVGRPGEALSWGDVTVSVEDASLCPRLTAQLLTGVRQRPSLPTVARRLHLCGMRPISNVVDASNYVMLELGQPTHPYDFDRLPGGGITARAARVGEQIETLDGVTRVLGVGPMPDCVIAAADGTPVGVAGVMGGASSEISPSTSRVLLEAAYFDPRSISATARRLGLRSEASARFERGCDPWGLEAAVSRFCQLLGRPDAEPGQPGSNASSPASWDQSGGTPLLDITGDVPRATRIRVRLERVEQVLGLPVERDRMATLLEPMGFSVSDLLHEPEHGQEVEPGPRRAGGGAATAPRSTVEVTVPSWRPDTSREVDVAEEVARQWGYGKISPLQRRPVQVGRLSPLQRTRRAVRRAMVGLGASEVWTPTLLAAGEHKKAGMATVVELKVANPLVAEEAVLRSSLLPGLLACMARNLSRGHDELRMFEVGHVFAPPAAGSSLPEEADVAALLLARESDGAEEAVRSWRALAHALVLTDASVEADQKAGLHPGRSASLFSAGVHVGSVGEVDPAVAEAFGLASRRLGWLQLDVGRLACVPPHTGPLLLPSRFPPAEFDLSFAVDDSVPAETVQRTLARAAGPWSAGVALFDVYRGQRVQAGSRGLAFRLRFVAPDHTLDERELADLRRSCVQAVEQEHPATLRT